MNDFIIGSVIVKSVTHRFNKTFFYALNGKRKVLIVLEDHVILPDCLDGSFEFRGRFGFSNKNRVLKLRATSMTSIPDIQDPREELRQFMDTIRQ